MFTQPTNTHAHDDFEWNEWISHAATLVVLAYGKPIHSLHVSAVKRTERMSLVTQFNVEVANAYFSNIEKFNDKLFHFK